MAIVFLQDEKYFSHQNQDLKGFLGSTIYLVTLFGNNKNKFGTFFDFINIKYHV